MSDSSNVQSKETIALAASALIIGAGVIYWAVQVYNAASTLMLAYG